MAITPVRFPTAPRGYSLDNEAAFRRQVGIAFAQVAQEVEAFQIGAHTHDAGDLVSGTLANGRVAESNVTQHQSALILAATQVTSGTFASARISQASVTQHQAALALAASQITSGTLDDARVAQSNVTQHQAALSIAETQVADGSILARLAANETVSGTWAFDNRIAAPAAGISIGGATNFIRLDGGRLDFVIGGTVVASIDASGNLRALGDVTADDTP